MNKHDKEAAAAEKRRLLGLEYERKRKKRAKDAYQCYLVYMKRRKQL